MSDLDVFVTLPIPGDTPMDMEVSNGVAVITLGEQGHIALEFHDPAALDRLRDLATNAITTMLGQHSADPEAREEPAGGAP